MFQTQTVKCGEVDVSCRDYVLSWGTKLARVDNSYTPDLHSDFGIERDTGKKMRLPTPAWPFDHAGVAVRFKPADTRLASLVQGLSVRPLLRFLQAILILYVLYLSAYPVYADWTEKCSVTGKHSAGRWGRPDNIVEAVSVCEAPAPCPDGSWTLGGPTPS